MTKILVVEDEEGLQTILKYNLEKEGYQTIAVMDGKKAIETILAEDPDLILLDWMLPHVSGVEICKMMRQNHDIRHIPVLMLTARGDEADKVSGLSIGADDYMTKPFSIPELMARIKALLRRAPPKPPKQAITFADMVVDFDKKQVMRGERMVHIGPTEFRLLQIFLENPERVFSRAELLKKVWGDAIYVEDRTVDVHVKRLRQALNAGGEDDIIRTVRSAGYALSEMKKN